MIKNYLGKLGIFVLFCFILLSCSKMDQYKDFIDGKDFLYSGKADSLRIHPGDGRVGVSWLLTSDPNIVFSVIYWNNKKDSIVLPVDRTLGVDSVIQIINLPEGTYNFEVYNVNKKGIFSVPAYATGKSYGESYKNSLLNRGVSSSYIDWDGSAVVEWGPAEETTIGVKLQYTDDKDEQHEIAIPNEEEETHLEHFKANSSFQYETMFKPDSLALNTFYAPLLSVKPE